MNLSLNNIQIVFHLCKVIIQENDSNNLIVYELILKMNRSLFLCSDLREVPAIQESDSYRFIMNVLCPKKNRSLLFISKGRERLKLNPNFVVYEQN